MKLFNFFVLVIVTSIGPIHAFAQEDTHMSDQGFVCVNPANHSDQYIINVHYPVGTYSSDQGYVSVKGGHFEGTLSGLGISAATYGFEGILAPIKEKSDSATSQIRRRMMVAIPESTRQRSRGVISIDNIAYDCE